MMHGSISLKDLYIFTEKHAGDEDALRIERTPLGREYCRLVEKSTSSVPDAQGFYLWGRYDRKKYWASIYLGKAGFSTQKSLRKRISEELKDDRCAVWRSRFTVPELHTVCDRIHGTEAHKNFWERAMKKEGTTHLIWVATPAIANENLTRVEADLIEALNPTANIMRPLPADDVQENATSIFQQFRLAIHEARSSAFRLEVKRAPATMAQSPGAA
jgi:hypothetical protein